jgi:hypothetical protein
LKELHLMRKSGAPVIPVFYHVKPSSLRPDEGDVQPRYHPDTIQKWRNALSSFADLSGFELDGGKFNGRDLQLPLYG